MRSRLSALLLAATLLLLPAGSAWAGAGCEMDATAKAAASHPCCAEDAAAERATRASEAGPMPCCEAGPSKTTEPVEAAAPAPPPAPAEAEVVEASALPTNLGALGPIGLGALAALAVSAPLFLKNRSLRN